MSQRLTLIGAFASPYTRKMIALLRYRQIPYRLIWGDPGQVLNAMGIEKPRPLLFPTFLLTQDDGKIKAVCDSTPIIQKLEQKHTERKAIPTNPTLAFINDLLEDFSDEWGTKYMFHYRWCRKVDADYAGAILPLGTKVDLDHDSWQFLKQAFSQRQIERLWVVGSNETTAPIIEASYQRLLIELDILFAQQPYLLGQRPSAADFALYGQLTQLVGFDQTPSSIARDIAPRTIAWTAIMEDGSGVDPQEDDWNSVEQLSLRLKPLLTEVGRCYAPTMLANAQAHTNGEESWETSVDGKQWQQPTFNYQAKCLKLLRQQYVALNNQQRQQVDSILQGSGCETLFVNAD